MGQRALVAYRQSDGSYILRYAHWGDGLARAIGPSTPLGGPAPGGALGSVADELGVGATERYDSPTATRVALPPLVTDATPADVVAAVDASYESLVVVSPAFEAATYLVCSLDPVATGTDLVFAAPEGDPESLRGWFVEAKSRLAGVVDDDEVSRAAARATLRRALAARATLYPGDDASFIRGR